MLLAWAFTICVAILCILTLLAVLSLGRQHPLGDRKEREGLELGRRAPLWQVADREGILRHSPLPGTWQLLLLADHLFGDLPAVIGAPGGPAVLQLVRERPGPVTTAIAWPVVMVPAAIHRRYNVRGTPYLILIDPAGRVRASSPAACHAGGLP
jgi:hypothetical protein